MGAGYAIFCPSNKLTFDLLILKVLSESRVTWATSVPILIFLGLSVLDLGPIYATDRLTYVRQTNVRQHHRLMPPPRGGGIITSLKFLLEVDLHRLYFSVDLSVTVYKMLFFLRTRSVHARFLLKVIDNKTSFSSTAVFFVRPVFVHNFSFQIVYCRASDT